MRARGSGRLGGIRVSRVRDAGGTGLRELVSRARAQPAPPHILFDSLRDPHSPGARPWLALAPDELEPRVLEQVRPRLLVWSSLWPDRPADLIRFDLEPDAEGSGCLLRWTLLTPDPVVPPDSVLGHLRKRLNVLINEKLRLSYGA
jgi:hypothetical protein